MYRSVTTALALASFSLMACPAEAEPTITGCAIGSEGCECTGGGACDPGLTCFSNLCVNASSGADAGATDVRPDTGTGDLPPVDVPTVDVVLPESGTVVARYSLGPASCADLALTGIRARVRSAAGVVAEASQPCSGTGEITLSPVPQGIYAVVIEGLDGAVATHEARQDGVVVPASGNVTTDELLLAQKPASLAVSWLFADNLACIDNEVVTVEATLRTSTDTVVETATTSCEGTYIDPEDQVTKAGLLFPSVAVASGTTFKAEVVGYDAQGDIVRVGTVSDITLDVAEHERVFATLSPGSCLGECYAAIQIADVPDHDCSANSKNHGADIDAAELFEGGLGSLGFATEASGAQGPGTPTCADPPNSVSLTEALGAPDSSLSGGFVPLGGGYINLEFAELIRSGDAVQIYQRGEDVCGFQGCKDEPMLIRFATSLPCAWGDDSCSVAVPGSWVGDAIIPAP